MTRTDAIARARQQLHSGAFLAELDRRVAFQTESQNPERGDALRAYLEQDLQPAFSQLDFATKLIESPSGKGPYLLAEYRESSSAPTILMYGHGDVVDGMAGEWRDNLDPWRTTTSGNRVYGRGTADNKGQHSINMSALRAVREARGGRLGFNAKFIIETGEEIGSPDLREVCESLRDELSADLFLASDGPRLSADRPTLFLGCRGGIRIHLDVNLRDGSHHSGNWGGVLANPATILASAIATLVDGNGRLLVEHRSRRGFPTRSAPHWPTSRSSRCRTTLFSRTIGVRKACRRPSGFMRGIRWKCWRCPRAHRTVANAIPGRAQAILQLRFVVGTKVDHIAEVIRAHLHGKGFPMIAVQATQRFAASRTDFDSPWINWTAESIRKTTGKAPAVLPNFGGSLPNDVFTETLGLPTMWVPHSYPGCSQHAPDEHMLLSVIEEALGIMAGLFWDLGELPRAL